MTITDSTGHAVPDPSNTSHYEPADDNQDDNQAAEDLAKLVAAASETRVAQQEYFRTKSSAALSKAKVAERRLDALLAELAGGDRQTRLF